jgi:hypothetical protein
MINFCEICYWAVFPKLFYTFQATIAGRLYMPFWIVSRGTFIGAKNVRVEVIDTKETHFTLDALSHMSYCCCGTRGQGYLSSFVVIRGSMHTRNYNATDDVIIRVG